MHRCIRCGKSASSLDQINNGCECGSRIFIFNKDWVLSKESREDAEDGKPPKSYYATIAFCNEDVENIKVIDDGVFSIDLSGLSENPVVVKDQEGVYYIKIEQKWNGKKR
ncbi:MAG: hypothetical protein QXN37_04280 [Candidatus Anstonellaceae archaeon]